MSDDIRMSGLDPYITGNYGDDFFSPPLARAPEGRCQVCGWPLVERIEDGCVPGNCSMRPAPSQNRCAGCVALESELRHATAVVRDLENKMLPVNEYVAKLEAALTLMYEGYAMEFWQRAGGGLGDEEIEQMQGRACQAVAELLPDLAAKYAEPEPEWFNADDDMQERLLGWFGAQ